VPWTLLDTWEVPSAISFERPKSETFALMCLSRRILLLFKSLWIMAGEQPVWRYSIPNQAWQYMSPFNYSIIEERLLHKQYNKEFILAYKPFAASSATSSRLIQLILCLRSNGPIKNLYTVEHSNSCRLIQKYLSSPERCSWEFLYAWTHKQASFFLLLCKTQKAVPGSCDVSLKEESPRWNWTVLNHKNQFLMS
jgi:hypothetical protein